MKKLALKTLERHRGQRLDQVLADWLPEALGQPVSKAKARKLIVAGAVYLNGKRVRIASKELLPGARVEAYVDIEKLLQSDGRSRDIAFEMTQDHVLYEDEDLIAVNKPPGLPTQPTLDEARANLYAAVKKFLAKREGVAEAYVGLHHRLDRDTSGVVLFTKRKEANAGVAALFADHLAVKTYHAIAERRPGARLPGRQWSTKNYLGRKPGSGKRSVFASVRAGGDFAHTDFKLLGEFPRAYYVEATPRTGRTHQIRVHLAEAGAPILGDETYGSRAAAGAETQAPRLMLHAVNLTFPHPIHKTEVSIGSPLPEDFSKCLARLRD